MLNERFGTQFTHVSLRRVITRFILGQLGGMAVAASPLDPQPAPPMTSQEAADLLRPVGQPCPGGVCGTFSSSGVP
jgi:hypothetical protein